MSVINDFLTEAGVFYLSTVNGVQPKCRPLGLHLEVDDKILFGVGDFKDVFRQINRNKRVEIVACKPDGHWLRYTGRVVFETDDKYAELALEASPELREIYNDETGYYLKMFHLEKAKAVIIPVMGEGTVILDETGETGKSETFTGDFDEDRASKVLHNGLLEAERTLKDTQKMEHFFQRLENKLKQVPVVGNKLADVPVMCSLVYNYVNKKYTEVPIGSIMAIISALTYFISPVDMIPDAVPGLGYMDDAAVITACLALVHSDLAEYQKWREENNIETTLEEELSTSTETTNTEFIEEESSDITSLE